MYMAISYVWLLASIQQLYNLRTSSWLHGIN